MLGIERKTHLRPPSQWVENLLIEADKKVTPKQLSAFVESWRRRDNKFLEKHLQPFRRLPTPQEEQVLNVACDKTKELLRRHQLEKIQIDPSIVFILKEPFWARIGANEEEVGCFFNQRLMKAVAVRDSQPMGKMFLAVAAFHELLHLVSFRRARIYSKWKIFHQMQLERSGGISVANPQQTFFCFLDEAVALQLEKRFAQSLMSEPLFEDECSRLKELQANNPDAYYVVPTQEGEWAAGQSYDYLTEDFEHFLDDIFHWQPHPAKSREEIFAIFEKAFFSGRLLELARLIEKVYGKGSFRLLGEKTSNRIKSWKEDYFSQFIVESSQFRHKQN
ncbi:hypothetical protein D6821_02810 [Candidatus Parcubacteria bacterium]|nr:MAG: hypothetical protein D6821_02810 [Candidatus Parcubacteria bacterium]